MGPWEIFGIFDDISKTDEFNCQVDKFHKWFKTEKSSNLTKSNDSNMTNVDRSIPNIFSVGLDKEIVPTESSITQENAN